MLTVSVSVSCGNVFPTSSLSSFLSFSHSLPSSLFLSLSSYLYFLSIYLTLSLTFRCSTVLLSHFVSISVFNFFFSAILTLSNSHLHSRFTFDSKGALSSSYFGHILYLLITFNNTNNDLIICLSSQFVSHSVNQTLKMQCLLIS